MDINLSERGEFQKNGTAPTRKGSAAKMKMAEKYILKIKAANERSSGSGEAKTTVKLDEPALFMS